ncbi:RNA ligase family protein [Chryseobacterium sp. 5_R23647]|uniref:RNA ligase family protein n=1 Tax=Chryseobacterium sp. 5_R23647 TaxID=2258964 RepID=UPI000E257759|nr:RNA ligase family protein [Chryseobacterium sp. 5_R23647]REC42987.1 2'-5' RNA ligase [Chryseobacterium sp. 5_R23647]
MSEFSGYEKMPNNLKKLGLNENDFSQMEKFKWVVTEKVHGANFSFVYENGILKFAKRKEYLNWTDDFFGFQLVVNKLEDNILRLFEKLSNEISGEKYMVYGELFGGKYPHPEVNPIKDLHAIQTGVYYTPSIEFCAFDIALETNGSDSKYYLDYEISVAYFQQFEIFHAQPLLIGKFNEAMNFNIRMNSSIPKGFNLPELQENLIEGVVIKPFSQTDSTLFSRPIIKLKNPEFDEEDKFHEAEKWSFIPDISSKTEDLSFIVDELRNYVTQNRLKSVISKIGTLDINNQLRISEIKTEFLEDVITDFNENNNNLLNDLSSGEKEWIMERISFDINRIIIPDRKDL